MSHENDRDDGENVRDIREGRRRSVSERRERRLESKLLDALSSPALNGGFDTLLSKVERIEESQGMLVSKVNDVHEAIYNPDDGLFARIKSAEAEREKDIVELQAWRESVNKDLLLDAEQDRELKEKVEKHELTIAELRLHRDRVVSMAKWFFVALGGGAITLLVNWLTTLIGG